MQAFVCIILYLLAYVLASTELASQGLFYTPAKTYLFSSSLLSDLKKHLPEILIVKQTEQNSVYFQMR